MRLRRFIGFPLLLIGLTGCEAFGPSTSDADLQIIDTRKLTELMEDEAAETVLVDVRPAEAYAAGHLPRAIHIPLPALDTDDPRLKKENVVVYGNGLEDVLSAAAAKELLGAGYDEVFDFRGGMDLWKAEGRPVVQEMPGTGEGE